jgi:hypothetical protein
MTLYITMFICVNSPHSRSVQWRKEEESRVDYTSAVTDVPRSFFLLGTEGQNEANFK